MKTLRYKRSVFVRGFISLNLLLAVVLFLGYLGVAFFLSSANITPFESTLVVIGFLVIFLLFLFNSIAIALSHRFEFHADFIEEHVLRLVIKPFKCTYENIASIKKVAPGQIMIVSRTGEKLYIFPDNIQGGETALFDVLTQYIPADRFEANLRDHYKKKDPTATILGVLSASFMMIALAFMLFQNRPVVPLPLGWNYFSPWSTARVITGASIESPDSVWVIHSKLFQQDIIEHITGNQTKTWTLPKAASEYANQRILIDSQQQPVLITLGAIFFLRNGEWQKLDFTEEPSAFIFPINSNAVVANDYWTFQSNKNAENHGEQFIHIQADSPQPQAVTLLDPATQKPLNPKMAEIASDGTVLLLSDTTIYLLRREKIQSQLYPVAMKDRIRIADFTLADDGNIYVLFSSSNDTQNFVEKIDAQGTQMFTQLPVLLYENGSYESYKSIEVDSRGRLWLAGTYPAFVKVVEAAWGGEAHEIVEYNLSNSNYGSGLLNSPLLTADGRIWAADSYLIWIDSNAAQLPTPLPNWLAQIREAQVSSSSIITFQLLTIILSLISVWRMRRQNRTKK